MWLVPVAFPVGSCFESTNRTLWLKQDYADKLRSRQQLRQQGQRHLPRQSQACMPFACMGHSTACALLESAKGSTMS